MAFPVFISYSSKDKVAADSVRAAIEASGVDCWMAPRDILPGGSWPTAIVRAISNAKVMVLVFSSHSNLSHQVAREVELAASRPIPIVPLKIEKVPLVESMRYFIGNLQGLDAWPGPLQEYLQQLVRAVRAILETGEPTVASTAFGPAQAATAEPKDLTQQVPVFRDTAWKETKSHGDLSDFEAHLETSPSGTFVDAAVCEIARLIEKAAWEPASHASSPEGDVRYLQSVTSLTAHPDARVRAELIRLARQRALTVAEFAKLKADVSEAQAAVRIRRALAWPENQDNSELLAEWARRNHAGRSRLLAMSARQGIDAHCAAISAIEISENGLRVISGGRDGALRIWSLAAGQLVALIRTTSTISSLRASADGQILAIGGKDGRIILWDLSTTNIYREIAAHNGEVCALDFTPNGRQLLSGGTDHMLKLWDVATGRCAVALQRYWGCPLAVAVAPDGMSAVSGGSDRILRLWDLNTGQCVKEKRCSDVVSSIKFTTERDQVLLSSHDRTVHLWNVGTQELYAVGSAHKGRVNCVASSIDGRLIVSGGSDGQVHIWDTSSRTRRELYHDNEVTAVAITPNSRQIISGSRDRSLRVWDEQTTELLWEAKSPPWALPVAAALGDQPDHWTLLDSNGDLWSDGTKIKPSNLPPSTGNYRANGAMASTERGIFLSGERGRIFLASRRQWREIMQSAPRAVPITVALTREGNLAAVLCAGKVACYRVDDALPLGIFSAPARPHPCIAISTSAGNARPVVAAAGADGNLIAWNPFTEAIIATCSTDLGKLAGIAITPDGGKVIFCFSNRGIGLWDLYENRCVPGKAGAGSRCMYCSADGHWAFTGGDDGVIRVWSTDSLTCVYSVQAHAAAVSNLQLDQSGNRLISVGTDKSLRIWDLLWDWV